MFCSFVAIQIDKYKTNSFIDLICLEFDKLSFNSKKSIKVFYALDKVVTINSEKIDNSQFLLSVKY